MAKQCPRCWEKVSPDDQVCPNCGYEFNRRAAQQAEPEAETEQKRSIFPQVRTKDRGDDTGPLFKIVFIAIIAWAILSVAGGAYNLYLGNWIQGAGFLMSGIVAAVAAMFLYRRERRMLCALLVLISGAATFQIALLVVSFGVSYLVMCCKQYFSN